MRYLIFIFIALFLGCIGERGDTGDTLVSEEKMSKIVVLETSMGDIEISLDEEKAPVTVKNFLSYVDEGAYDGTVFHRVISDFMIQGGGFTVKGDKMPTKDPIRLESQNGLKNKNMTVAMARTNIPDSATNQFFINVKDNTNLDFAPGNPGYAVFGEVVSGQETVMKIKDVPTTTKGYRRDWPVTEVVIKKAYVKE